jgi:hypothetical protein
MEIQCDNLLQIKEKIYCETQIKPDHWSDWNIRQNDAPIKRSSSWLLREWSKF